MLVQRCALEQHRLVLPVSVTKPLFEAGTFSSGNSRRHYRALIDTGAQRSVVCRSVIADNELVRLGHMQFAGIHGPRTHTRYLASIGLWVKRLDSTNASMQFSEAELSFFALGDPFEIVDMDDNANYDLILGFDVLKAFSFSFDASSQIFELKVR